MISYKVSANKDQIAEAVSLFEFVGGNTDYALQIAINRAGPKVRSGSSVANNISQRIRAQIRVTAKFLNEEDSKGNKRLGFIKATRYKLSGAITTQSRGLLLSHFETNAKASLFGSIFTPDYPIKVKVKPSGASSTVTGSKSPVPVHGDPFYIRLKNSNAVGIAMWRVTPGPRGGRVHVFYGPSVSQVFNKVKDDVAPTAGEVLQAELLDAMRSILARKFPKE